MNVLITAGTLVAQTQSAPRAPSAMTFFPIALMVAVVAFMLLSARSQKKRERREREEMHARMAKNDRVLTIGGVIGTIIAVKDDEVVVKVDESTNTKMTFIKSAIQRVLGDEQSASADKR